MPEYVIWSENSRSGDTLLEDLFVRLQEDPLSLSTKDFLRAVFKWLKWGCKHYAPEKAFHLAEWVAHACSDGDSTLGAGVPALRQLQPSYVFNTIVTMSQRNNKPLEAQRAFARMQHYGLQPDIFTLTALMDVVGRHGDVEEAYRVYRAMLGSENTLPNVVTYCTLLRLTSKHVSAADGGAERVLGLVHDARRLALRPGGAQVSDTDGIVDSSIYNAALAASVRYVDRGLLETVLRMMRPSDTVGPFPPLTYEILCKFTIRHVEECGGTYAGDDLLLSMHQNGILSTEDIDEIKLHILNRQARGTDNSIKSRPADSALAQERLLHGIGYGTVRKSSVGFVENMSYLGPKSPVSLRTTVLNHDLTRLAQRLLSDREDAGGEVGGTSSTAGVVNTGTLALCETDFVTIIHQCRKRKWFEQVDLVLTFMRQLCTEGIPSAGVPAAPALALSMLTVEAALESYFAGGLANFAWDLFDDVCAHVESSSPRNAAMNIPSREELMDFSHRFPTLVISGFIGCMNYEYAARSFFRFRHDSKTGPSKELVLGMIRAAGRTKISIQAALSMLAELLLTRHAAPSQAQILWPECGPDVSLWRTAKVFPGVPIRVDFNKQWDYGSSMSGRAMSPLLAWTDVEDCLQTLLRSCSLLSGGDMLMNLIEFLIGLRSHSTDCSAERDNDNYYFERPCDAQESYLWALPVDQAVYEKCMDCLSDVLNGIVLRWDSQYMTTLLMSACSQAAEAGYVCQAIYVMQYRALLPPISCLYSQALDALGHSWAPDKKTAVVFETKKGEGSLPFRSFVLIGILKFLDVRAPFLQLVVDMLSSDPECGLRMYVRSEEWVNQVANAFSFVDPQDGNTGSRDPLLLCILTGLEQALQSWRGPQTEREHSSNCPALGMPRRYELPSMLFLQHCYARFANIKTKCGKECLEQDISSALKKHFSSFDALWKFTCVFLTELHLVGTKADEKSVVRFFAFFLDLLTAELYDMGKSTIGVLASTVFPEDSVGTGSKAKNRKNFSVIIYRFTGANPSMLPTLLSLSLVEMVRNVIDCGRGPFDYLKTAQKCLSVMSYDEFCRDIAEYLSRDIYGGLEKHLKLSQIIDFVIFYRNCLFNYLDTRRIEALLVQHLQADAGYYKTTLEYICNVVAPESKGVIAERWSASVRIARSLLSACEELTRTGGATNFEDHCSNAVVADTAVKLLFKLHPVTQQGHKDAHSVASRRVDIDAVIAEFTTLSSCVDSRGAAGVAKESRADVSVTKSTVECDEKTPYYKLPLAGDRVVIVNDNDTATLALQLLCESSAGVSIVGIDAEWKPMTQVGDFNKCSLLQIACRTHVFLFDLMVLEPSYHGNSIEDGIHTLKAAETFSRIIQLLFTTDTVLKLGFGLKGDLDRLRESFPDSRHYNDFMNSLDLRSMVKGASCHLGVKSGGGLSTFLHATHGAILNKRMQMSDWEARPLSDEQIDYAAKDAYCLIEIYDALSHTIP